MDIPGHHMHVVVHPLTTAVDYFIA